MMWIPAMLWWFRSMTYDVTRSGDTKIVMHDTPSLELEGKPINEAFVSSRGEDRSTRACLVSLVQTRGFHLAF